MSDQDVSTAESGGLIDVGGLSFAELAEAVAPEDLGRALDRILASGENGNGYHGFTSRI